MTDPRTVQFAHNLINYSLQLKAGEKLLIENFGPDISLVKELVREAYAVGANPFVSLKNPSVFRSIFMGCNQEQIAMMSEYECVRMRDMDCYLGIRGSENAFEMGDVPADKMRIYSEVYSKPLHSKIRVPHTRWCVMRWPDPAMAQLAGTSTEAFEDFYFKVCNLDYSKMSRAMDNLVRVLERTDRVRITAPNTDLSFSIKGLPAIKCDGKLNIPDGEVYTAPVADSVNGRLTYNTPTLYQGTTFENVSLLFKDGKIIDATSNNTEKLNHILDTDPGARFVGEFALGVNPFITTPMKDTLFDEKIRGSIHFTPGCCYDECDNGNKSAIHLDMVLIQTPEYGGGEIYFDDVLVRKDGMFVIDELLCLNPEALK